MCSRSVTSTRGITVTSSASTIDEAQSPKSQPAGNRILRVGAGGRRSAGHGGGGAANPAQFPYAVAIFRKGHMHCSGSVIGPTKILTAGHCVAGFNVANFQ